MTNFTRNVILKLNDRLNFVEEELELLKAENNRTREKWNSFYTLVNQACLQARKEGRDVAAEVLKQVKEYVEQVDKK